MRRLAHVVGVFAVLALVVSSCASGKDTGLPAGPTEEASPSNRVLVIDSAFDPKTLDVAANTEVVWEQTGSAPHSVTADDGSFDSNPDCRGDANKCMQKGDEFRFTFTQAGEYPYYCVIHGARGGTGMAGVIIVK